ncbi:MAG: hypothetical protein K2L02_02210 [Clostridia bacterium]|nr:hypothetical protein [Clostridia bacterium]
MDKFGIFELLDTLAQIASDAQPEENKKDETPSPRVSPDDKSFLPPDFNGTPTEEQKTSRSAINSLYERHESISKRIDKKK